jgi:hypothetical protein
MKNKHHKEIQEFIWNRKNKPFEFSELKKQIHKYTNFGGSRYKKWIKAKYGLREFKENGRVMLQKIPKDNEKNE